MPSARGKSVHLLERAVPGQDHARRIEQQQAHGAALEDLRLQGVQAADLVGALADLAHQSRGLDRRRGVRGKRADEARSSVVSRSSAPRRSAMASTARSRPLTFIENRWRAQSIPGIASASSSETGLLDARVARPAPARDRREPPSAPSPNASKRVGPGAHQHLGLGHAQRVANARTQQAQQRGQVGLGVELAGPVEQRGPVAVALPVERSLGRRPWPTDAAWGRRSRRPAVRRSGFRHGSGVTNSTTPLRSRKTVAASTAAVKNTAVTSVTTRRSRISKSYSR